MKIIRTGINLGLVILGFSLFCTTIVVVVQKTTALDAATLSEVDQLVHAEISKRYQVTEIRRDKNHYRLSGSKDHKEGNFQYEICVTGVWYRIFVKWRKDVSSIKVYSVRFAGTAKPEPKKSEPTSQP